MKRIMSLLLAVVLIIGVCPAVSADTADSVSQMVSQMSLYDKVTQMMMVELREWDGRDLTVMNTAVSNLIKRYRFGGVVLFSDNLQNTEQAFTLVKEMQLAATANGGTAMLIAADQEGGSVYRLQGGTALPGNMAVGATYAAFGTHYAYESGKIIGSELASLGINTNLAPVVDVNNNPNNPVIGLRSYGDDAQMVGELASATINGMSQYNVIGCAKHFPGHGDTATDSHYGLPVVNKPLSVLKENELKPYEVAIDQGIDMIMTAHILYPQLESDKIVSQKTGKAESLPATMSDDVLTGLLKNDMGFDGIVITDAMNMAGVTDKWSEVQAAVIAVQAGADMICRPCATYCEADFADFDTIISGVIKAVENGTIPMSRINDAVTRILTVKEKKGLLDYNAADYTLANAKATVGSTANRETEREIAAAAVTVIKNHSVLPLSLTSKSRVLMAVPYDNERAQMIMGWNRAVKAEIVPKGAEVEYVRFSSSTTLADLKPMLDRADAVIVNSEMSSASRMAGKHWLSSIPSQITTYCKTNGKISVVLSVDKPYDVQMYANADAILAVYGCKGSTVDPTEALLGGATGSNTAYGPNIIAGVEVALGTFEAAGKLPLSIPKYDSSANIYTADIVYERGYGLTNGAVTYPDVPRAAWYHDAVSFVSKNGIMMGYKSRCFGATDSLKRQDFVVMLARLANADLTPYTQADGGMTDVVIGSYYAPAVAWAVDNGIVTGYQSGKFGVGDTVTREQVATILYRYKEQPAVENAGETLDAFPDGSRVSPYAMSGVAWAVQNNVIAGLGSGKLSPGGSASRAQIATIIMRMCQNGLL